MSATSHTPTGTVWSKACTKCGVVQPASAFNRDRSRKDGLCCWCQTCGRAQSLKYWYRNHETLLAKRIEGRDDGDRARGREEAARQQQCNPDKVRARQMFGNAVKRGRIQRQPCEKCGVPNAQGHHEDYSKPYDVRWMCRRCHAIEHRQSAIGLAHAKGELK